MCKLLRAFQSKVLMVFHVSFISVFVFSQVESVLFISVVCFWSNGMCVWFCGQVYLADCRSFDENQQIMKQMVS